MGVEWKRFWRELRAAREEVRRKEIDLRESERNLKYFEAKVSSGWVDELEYEADVEFYKSRVRMFRNELKILEEKLSRLEV